MGGSTCRRHTGQKTQGNLLRTQHTGLPGDSTAPHVGDSAAGRPALRAGGAQPAWPTAPSGETPQRQPSCPQPEQGQAGCSPDRSPLIRRRLGVPARQGGTHACRQVPVATQEAPSGRGRGSPVLPSRLVTNRLGRPSTRHKPIFLLRLGGMETKPFAAPTSWAPHPHTSAPTVPLGPGQGRPPCQAVARGRGGAGSSRDQASGETTEAGGRARWGGGSRGLPGGRARACAAPAGPVGPRVHRPTCPGTGHTLPGPGPGSRFLMRAVGCGGPGGGRSGEGNASPEQALRAQPGLP